MIKLVLYELYSAPAARGVVLPQRHYEDAHLSGLSSCIKYFDLAFLRWAGVCHRLFHQPTTVRREDGSDGRGYVYLARTLEGGAGPQSQTVRNSSAPVSLIAHCRGMSSRRHVAAGPITSRRPARVARPRCRDCAQRGTASCPV